MSNSLEYLLEKFPDHRSRIIVLYYTDEDFRILCDDYLVSVQGVEEFRGNALKSKNTEIEFALVCVELEREIIKMLSATHSL
jgi:hypothetical protein